MSTEINTSSPLMMFFSLLTTGTCILFGNLVASYQNIHLPPVVIEILQSLSYAGGSSLGYIPEDVSNKSTSVNTDQASSTKYPSVKAVYDWVTSLFVKKGTLTANTIPKATASDTIGDSSITDDGTNVNINSETSINGSFNAISNDGNSSTVVEDGDVYSQWTNGIISSYQNNDANESSLTFYNGSIGFSAFIKAKEFSNDIFHSVKNTFSSPLHEFNNIVKLTGLTASQIVETDASKNLVSVAKQDGYNLPLGTTAGTVLEGDRITQVITNGVTDKVPSQNAVYDALALKADIASPTFTTQITTPQINIPSGTGPTSPSNGDIWFDGTEFKMQTGNQTVAVPNQRYYASSIPMILPSSGSIGNNGALTLATALPNIYTNCYMYFPANAISAGSASGFYYVVMTSTTVGTIYNNTYTVSSGIATAPTTPTAFVTVGSGAYTQNTNTTVYATRITIPANYLGENGFIEMKPIFSRGGSGGAGNYFGYFGAQQFMNLVTVAATTNNGTSWRIMNKTYNKQLNTNWLGYGVGAAVNEKTVNTSVATNIELALTQTNANDYHILEAFICEIFKSTI